jgi:hypothetical protein
MRYQPRNSLPLRTELCTWPSKRVAIRFGPRSRERRMPRAPRRCLGTAPKFPCAVSETKHRCRKARTCCRSFGAFATSGLSYIKHVNSHCSCTMATYRWAALRRYCCKVENRATRKISRELIFGLLCRYVAFQRHYAGPRSILDETIWSLTSPRVKRIRGSKSFRSAPRKDFCNKNRTSIFQPLLNASRREGLRPFGTIIREGARRRGCPVVVQGKHFNLPPLVFLGEDGITGVWRTIF